MLTIASAPDYFSPNPMGQPSEWAIYNPDYLISTGQSNTYVVRITGIGANGQNFRLAGEDLSTDDALPYTSTTFDHTVSDFRSALNMANMLRANASFRAYSVRTARPSNGQPWRVIIIKSERADATVAEQDNDFSALTNVTVELIQGSATQTLSARLWYQFWGSAGPISPELFAPFDLNGYVKIDAQQAARQLLNPAPPDVAQTLPRFDLAGAAYVSLKYGTYQTDGNCAPVFGSASETPPAPFLDAVLQHDQTEGLTEYGPTRTGPLKWLTRRPNNRTVNTYGFEWTAIYLGASYIGLGNSRRVLSEFFDLNGVLLGSLAHDINDVGLWRIPTGYQNAVPDGLNGVDSFTIVVQTDLLGAWVNESEVLTIKAAIQGCQAAEIYYLEGLGSWGTLQFEELNERGLTMAAEGWQRPVLHNAYSRSPDDSVLYDQGGNYQRVTQSATTLTLTTYRVAERRRKQVEEMLESPAAYLLTETEDGQIITRRITFSRESYRVAQDQGRATITVSFTFAQPRRLR